MVRVSLALNVLVLIPVTILLATDSLWASEPFGERTPARDVLIAVYFAILISSLALLVASVKLTRAPWLLGAVAALLSVQIIYKVLTAITVADSLSNPVVLSNLGIVVVHAITLTGIVRALSTTQTTAVAAPITTVPTTQR